MPFCRRHGFLESFSSSARREEVAFLGGRTSQHEAQWAAGINRGASCIEARSVMLNEGLRFKAL